VGNDDDWSTTGMRCPLARSESGAPRPTRPAPPPRSDLAHSILVKSALLPLALLVCGPRKPCQRPEESLMTQGSNT